MNNMNKEVKYCTQIQVRIIAIMYLRFYYTRKGALLIVGEK
jgi:hypothetical protein